MNDYDDADDEYDYDDNDGYDVYDYDDNDDDEFYYDVSIHKHNAAIIQSCRCRF